jgi:hypothetical protein
VHSTSATILLPSLGEVSVEGRVEIVPARLNGPPEDCHPDESECELTAATWLGHNVLELVESYWLDEAEQALVAQATDINAFFEEE